jgi:hypothetical protein
MSGLSDRSTIIWGVDHVNDGAGFHPASHDVARQQQSDAGSRQQRPMCVGRTTCAKDNLLVDLDAELVAQRLPDVDLGEDAEPLVSQHPPHVGDDVIERSIEDDAHCVGHLNLFSRVRVA